MLFVINVVRTIKLNKMLVVMIIKCLTKIRKQLLSLFTAQILLKQSGAKLPLEIILFDVV